MENKTGSDTGRGLFADQLQQTDDSSAYDPDALSLKAASLTTEMPSSPAPTTPLSPSGFSGFMRRFVIILVVVLLVGTLGIFWIGARTSKNQNNAALNGQTNTVEIPLAGLDTDLGQTGSRSVTINGPLTLNDTFALTPQVQPVQAVAGQMYYDKTSNKLNYYNGTKYVTLDAGVLSITSGNQLLSVSDDGSGNIVLTAKAATTTSGSGGVTTAGGTAGRIVKFTGVSTVANSLLSDDGTTVTVGGNLTVTGSVGLSTPLSVANGGTGANSVALNGVVIGNGTGALTAVTAAGAGLCFVSTAGAPAFQACPGGVASAFTQDGNSFAAQATLGTNDANTLAFETNNVTQATIAVGGAATFQNSVNSTAAFRVLSSGATPILTVSTTGNAVIVQGTSTAGSGSSLQFGNDGALTIGEASGNPDVLTYNARVAHTFQIDGTNRASFTQNGGLQIDAANSFGGLYVTDNIGHNAFMVIGDGSSVQVGYSDNLADQLVVDTKLNAGDPTGINGGLYYNATAGKLRCFEGGAWKDCVDSTAGTGFVQGGNSFGALAVLGTNDGFDLALERNNVTQLTVGNGNVTLASNVDLLLQGATAYISNPQGQTNSEAFGAGATVGSANAVALGNNAVANATGIAAGFNALTEGFGAVALGVNTYATDYSVAVGNGARADNDGNNANGGAQYATAIGDNSIAAFGGIAIGYNADASVGKSIALGIGAVATSQYQLVIGADNGNPFNDHIDQVIVGNGVTSATPTGFTLQGTSGLGNNVAGASTTIAAGQGTGAALGGDIVFQTSAAGASGSSLNSLSTVATLNGSSLTLATDVDLLLQGRNAFISNQQMGSDTEAFGLNATVGNGSQLAVAVGANSHADTRSIALGANAYSFGGSSALGSDTTANADGSIAIGYASNSTHDASIAIGVDAVTTAANQLVVGAWSHPVTQAVLGNGVTNGTPVGFTLQGTSGSGSDVAGANVTIAGGQGTGSALGGNIVFQVSSAGVSGSSLNALSTVGTFSNTSLTLGTNIDLLLQGTTAYISNTQGQANSEAFGMNAAVGGTEAVAVGRGAQAQDQGAVAIGYNAIAGGFGSPVAIGEGANGTSWGVAIGEGANSGSNWGIAIGNNAAAALGSVSIGADAIANSGGVAIGQDAQTNGNDRIVIGNGAQGTADHQLVLGGPSTAGYVNDIYLGSGVTDTAPVSVTLNGTGGSGTDIQGAALNIAGGKGTGAGNGGAITFKIAAPSGSGGAPNTLSTVATISGSNGAVTLQNAVNSSSAFSVQNASGTQLLKVDSRHNPSDVVGNGSLEQNATGWSGKGSATVSRITSQQYIGTASLQVATTAASGDGAKYSVTLSSSTQYTVQFWAKLSSGSFSNMSFGYASDGSTDVDCKTNQNMKTTGWSVYNCTFTTGTVSGSPYFYWKQNTGVARTVYVDALQIVPGPDVGVYYEGKIDTSGLAFNGPVAIQNDNDSQAAMQVQSSSGTTVFGVDSLNFRVGVNLIQPTAALHVVTIGNNSVTALFNQNSTSTQDIMQLAKNAATTVAVAHDGTTTFQVLTDSTTAFRILSSNATFGSGTPQFVVDTSNSRVYIGNPTGDTTGALLVLDTKTGSGDPTGVNGGMYYNSNANKFRCYEHSNWKNCLGMSASLTLFGLNGNGAASTWTNMPSAETEFMVGVSGINNAANRIKYDLSDAEQIRLQVNVEAAGATNGEIRIQYSTDQSTWNYLDNANTGLGQNVSATGLKVSSWADVASGAKSDVFLRLTGINGDGAADPDFGLIQLQIR